ncbi:MAG: AAA family ATPase [Lachnospiraceae bacterium]
MGENEDQEKEILGDAQQDKSNKFEKMKQESIEERAKQLIEDQMYYWEPKEIYDNLPDSYVWAKVLKAAVADRELDEILDLTPLNSVLLTGPFGNGKHTTAYALMNELYRQNYQVVVMLNGLELNEESSALALAKVEALFQASAEYGKLCIYMENLADCRYKKEVMNTIADKLEEMEDELAPWFLILVEERAEILSARLLGRQILICPCCPPDFEERLHYIRQYLAGRVKLPLENIDARDMAELTEGFSYRQLSDLFHHLKLALKKMVVEKEDIASLRKMRIEEHIDKLEKQTVEKIISSIKVLSKKKENIEIPVVQTVSQVPGQTLVQSVVTANSNQGTLSLKEQIEQVSSGNQIYVDLVERVNNEVKAKKFFDIQPDEEELKKTTSDE